MTERIRLKRAFRLHVHMTGFRMRGVARLINHRVQSENGGFIVIPTVRLYCILRTRNVAAVPRVVDFNSRVSGVSNKPES